MKSLQEFYYDTDTKNNVHEYLIQYLKDEAVRMLMDREEPYAVADAKEVIDKAFDNLELLFSPKVKEKEQINGAR